MSGSAISAQPCTRRSWRRWRRQVVVIHGIDRNKLPACVFKRQRAICGRKVWVRRAFDGNPPRCPDCLKVYPELQVPEPGAPLARALGGPLPPAEEVQRRIEQELAAYRDIPPPRGSSCE